MTTAFQADAFQNNAFQIDTTPPIPPTPPVGGGGRRWEYVVPESVSDEDLLAAVWFMMLRNPYE